MASENLSAARFLNEKNMKIVVGYCTKLGNGFTKQLLPGDIFPLPEGFEFYARRKRRSKSIKG